MNRAAWVVGLALLAQLATRAAHAQTQPAPGTCLGGSCVVGAPVSRAPAPKPEAPARPSRGFAYGAAWFGLFSGALSLGGSIAIAMVNDPASERITRSVWLGYNALSTPLVAIGSLTTRKRARVQGYGGLRFLGWTVYTGTLTNGVAQLYEAFHDEHPMRALTWGLGILSVFAVLPHAFDAYATSHQARMKGLAFTPTPNGFGLHF